MQGLRKDCYSRFPCGLGRVVFLSFFVNLKVLSQGNLRGRSLQVYDWLTYGQNHLVLGFYLLPVSGSSLFCYSTCNTITHYQVGLPHFNSVLIFISRFQWNIYLKCFQSDGEDPLHKWKPAVPNESSNHVALLLRSKGITPYVQSDSIGRNSNLDKPNWPN